ncbi:MAG: HAD family phosphatase, partial [Oscillospiraceae bacterium]|nr:HAD family phosphatase [Oscillospiraceae bacterium]
MHINGAIFDMDGTLLDSMFIYETVYFDVLAELGHTADDGLFEGVRKLSGNEVLNYLRDTYAPDRTFEELNATLDAHLLRFYGNVPMPKSGIMRVLDTLRDAGVPMCICTATNRVHVEAALRRLGLSDYFAHIFTCAEHDTGKLEPKIFLLAAEFMGAEPTETVVFEDAKHAIATAKRVGFYVVAVQDNAENVNRDAIIATADEFY